MACARTNELTIYLIKQRRVPTLELDYPTNEEEVEDFIARIKNFLEGLK
jgi:putative methanogenesis marker protein 5